MSKTGCKPDALTTGRDRRTNDRDRGNRGYRGRRVGRDGVRDARSVGSGCHLGRGEDDRDGLRDLGDTGGLDIAG